MHHDRSRHQHPINSQRHWYNPPDRTILGRQLDCNGKFNPNAKNVKIEIRITNTIPNPFILKKNTPGADFHIISPHPQSTPRHWQTTNPSRKWSMSMSSSNLTRSCNRPKTSGSWHLTTRVIPPLTLLPRAAREIDELESIQKLNPHNSPHDRASFLANFKWEDSQLNEKLHEQSSKTYSWSLATFSPGIASTYHTYSQSLPCMSTWRMTWQSTQP